ncbi:hypothetical protein NQ317_018823 [Molorchus minor]|uniref:Peptidase aspartic putative domain-containing protein n=1 Tax=Molorchus minor TaxID=1323400 RepID=A0ABQ9JQD1_9CUCU|nr:hypothetical protein NQ317_018823 [Molorchus minor]
MSLTSLFDQLETQLRALETLGVTSDKYAAMLYPLVESALPEDILIVWERHRNNLKTTKYIFLKAEVESAERVKLARTSFVTEIESKGSNRNHVTNKVSQQEQRDSKLYTAATLLSVGSGGNKRFINICLFCDSKSHASKDYFKARSLSHNQKVDIVSKKNACFACLKTNHHIKRCKAFIKCIICGRKHYPILCVDLSKSKVNENQSKGIKENKCNEEVQNENTLVSSNAQCTLLQTVAVRIVSQDSSKVVRALLDSASQRSYIFSDCAKNLNLQVVDSERIIQSVFGGVQLSPTSHILYNLELQNIDGSFKCMIKALEQSKICNYTVRFENSDMIDELRVRNTIINDVYVESDEISLLLGADIYGKLLTGKIESLKNDLVAIETYLGWTLIGGYQENNSKLNTLCCFNDISILDLWSLEVLGIKDPIYVKKRDIIEAEVMKRFTETIIFNRNNRYEVELAWIDDRSTLLNNKELAKSRLLSTTKKLNTLNKYIEYNKVFEEWKELGIIEEVEVSDKVDESLCRINVEHYIPHHPVIKESHATTKIRPVFDASTKDRNNNSLNNCLEKGPNLLELIPDILLKFRVGLIGVISDIKKAFLQKSVSPKDRDVLRFLWWSEKDKEKIKIYRHTRVVFGVSSSPFLLAATIGYHLDRAPKHLNKTAMKLKESFYVDNCVTSVDNKYELKQFINDSKTLMELANFDLSV